MADDRYHRKRCVAVPVTAQNRPNFDEIWYTDVLVTSHKLLIIIIIIIIIIIMKFVHTR